MSSSKPCRAARAFAAVALTAAVTLLGACGYQPLYGQSTAGTDVSAVRQLADTEVAAIPHRSGQMMRTALERRLRITGRPDGRYVLHMGLRESRANLAEEKSGAVTRANLTLTGSFRLVRTADQVELLEGSETVVASFNILDSQFATLSAEQDARVRAIGLLADAVHTRLAIYFRGPHAEGKVVVK